MRRFSLLIFDLDNTLYDWYAAFLPAFYNMVGIASSLLSCEEASLLDELQSVHMKHGDVEHPFSLMETSIVRQRIEEYGEAFVWKLLDPAFHAFNRARKDNLRLFPDTRETLQELRSRRVKLVAYSDSKFYAASSRIERLHLGGLFDKIYCRERGKSVLPVTSHEHTKTWDTSKIVEIPSHESKPNPRVLSDIVTQQDEQMADVGYVGDSLAKDVLMAKRANCFAIWAKYGTHTDSAMYERLIRISHWTVEDIAKEKDYAIASRSVEADFVCERSLAELLSIVAGPHS